MDSVRWRNNLKRFRGSISDPLRYQTEFSPDRIQFQIGLSLDQSGFKRTILISGLLLNRLRPGTVSKCFLGNPYCGFRMFRGNILDRSEAILISGLLLNPLRPGTVSKCFLEDVFNPIWKWHQSIINHFLIMINIRIIWTCIKN